jgi:hypothetical protein
MQLKLLHLDDMLISKIPILQGDILWSGGRTIRRSEMGTRMRRCPERERERMLGTWEMPATSEDLVSSFEKDKPSLHVCGRY